MSSRTKSCLFWLIWLAVVIAVLWWFSCLASAAAPPLPGKKKHRQSAAVHQGAGALKLISKEWAASAAVIIPPGPRMWTNTIAWQYPMGWNEVTNFRVYRGPSPGVYTNSWLAGKTLSNKVAWTTKTFTFLSVTAIGTNGDESTNSNEIRLPDWPKSNLVVTVTCTNGGTNIAYSTSINGPWTKLNKTTWTATNPPAARYFRGIGAASNLLKISRYSY